MSGGLARRSFLAACITTVAALPPAALGDNPQVNLKTMLEKGLKARRPVEFRFVARVVELVENGTLPKKMVQKTFLWARKQPEHPFQYFQRALQIQASEIG